MGGCRVVDIEGLEEVGIAVGSEGEKAAGGREGGREGGKEGGREGGREDGVDDRFETHRWEGRKRREGGREEGRKEGREGGREGESSFSAPHAGEGAEATVGPAHDSDVIPQVAVTEIVVDHCRKGGREGGREGRE